MSIEKHVEICKEAKLEILDDVYAPFKRRLWAKLIPVYQVIQRFVTEHELISVRQFFYHAISIGLCPFPKNAKQAKNTYQNIDNIITRCRLGGVIPMDSISDTTDLLGIRQYNSIKMPIMNAIEKYRSNWWEEQDYYLEVWLEKRALEWVFYPITNYYGTYLSVAGGYPTLSQIKSAKDRFKQYFDKEFVILYFGDLDPSGKDMPRYLNERFNDLKIYDVQIEEVALTKNDVEIYNLPRNPFKLKDTRARWYIEKYGINYAVELDALPPNILKEKLEQSILEYIDLDILEECKKKDEEEKLHWIKKVEEL